MLGDSPDRTSFSFVLYKTALFYVFFTLLGFSALQHKIRYKLRKWQPNYVLETIMFLKKIEHINKWFKTPKNVDFCTIWIWFKKKTTSKLKKKKDNKRNVLKSFKAAKKRPCEKHRDEIALGNNDKETFTEFPLLFSFFKKYLIKMWPAIDKTGRRPNGWGNEWM